MTPLANLRADRQLYRGALAQARALRAADLCALADCAVAVGRIVWQLSLDTYRLSKTHDLAYCVRLTKAGVDVRALGGGL